MATHTIRLFGDPVLKRPTALVDDIDGTVLKLVDAMYETMYDAPGVGLAAPQVGVQKRFFVYDVQDVGSFDPNPVDFPDIARQVAAAITSGRAERGLMICGTGVGAAIGANKMKGIRAAVCHDVHSAHQSVEHDDVNVMCIGAQIVGPWLTKDLIAAYLEARFSTAEEFRRRVAKLADMDEGR